MLKQTQKAKKMKVYYTRISCARTQNDARQKENIPKDMQIYNDEISGSTEFNTRPAGKKLLADIEAGKVTEVQVHSIDRLGRNTLDILQTIQNLTAKGVNVISTKEGLQTIIDGKENPLAKLMVGILSTLAEFELARIKERQAEGIAAAKAKNAYKDNGRKFGTVETTEEFLAKASTKKILKYIKQGYSLRTVAKLSECSMGKVQKVNNLVNEKSK